MSNVCTGCVLYCHSCRYYAASADLVVSTASKLADVLGCFSHQRSYKIVFQKTSLDSINVILLKFNFGKGIGRNFHIEGPLLFMFFIVNRSSAKENNKNPSDIAASIQVSLDSLIANSKVFKRL